MDTDVQQEYARQREYPERTVASLRYKFHKDQDVHRTDNVKIMQENVTLIKEINQLRRNLSSAKQKERALECEVKVAKIGSQPGQSKLPPLVGAETPQQPSN